MERPKIIVLATVPRENLRLNKLERFCKCQKQLNSYWKRSSPAVNRGPGRPTDSWWPLLITAIPLLVFYLENWAAYSGIFWLTEDSEMNANTATWLEGHGALPSFKVIEDSLLRNAAWDEKLAVRARDIIAGKNRTCPFEWFFFQKFIRFSFKAIAPIIRTFHKLERMR